MIESYYKSFFAILLLSLILPGCLVQRHSELFSSTNQYANNSSSECNFPYEYQFKISDEEEIALSELSNCCQSLDDYYNYASKGNSAALWFIGECFSQGQAGLPFDLEMAKYFFSLSSSLGFAQSMTTFICMGIDNQDQFLSAIYENLVVILGHPESFHMYYDYFLKGLSPVIVHEIEKIATHKYKKILRNMSERDKNGDDWISKIDSITDEDILFTSDYWLNAEEGNAPKDIDAWIRESENSKKILEYRSRNAEYRQNQLKTVSNKIDEYANQLKGLSNATKKYRNIL